MAEPMLVTLATKMLTPGDIIFSVDQGLEVMRITGDGCLKRGAGFATDDAASVAFFDVLARCFPSWIAELRERAEKAEAELAALRDRAATENGGNRSDETLQSAREA